MVVLLFSFWINGWKVSNLIFHLTILRFQFLATSHLVKPSYSVLSLTDFRLNFNCNGLRGVLVLWIHFTWPDHCTIHL
jgi:hypothetical protein